MDIRCDASVAAGYKSGSQIARCITEHWCGRELYCAACSSNALRSTARNTPSTDFICPQCLAKYQVKSSSQPPRNRIVDAAYSAMIRAIRENATPHLIVLHYTTMWTIHNALLVPAFFLAESTIEPRKPLASSARRAGWVGCNSRRAIDTTVFRHSVAQNWAEYTVLGREVPQTFIDDQLE